MPTPLQNVFAVPHGPHKPRSIRPSYTVFNNWAALPALAPVAKGAPILASPGLVRYNRVPPVGPADLSLRSVLFRHENSRMRDAFRKAQLKRMVEDTDTWQGRAFDHVVKGLILFSVITYSLETLPDLSDRTQQFLYALEVAVVVIFTAEYALRLYVADRKLAYVFSPLGIIDLLAILPFYILLGGADSRAVRAMRLLRIARTLKLIRYNQAVDRLLRAVVIAREEIILFFSLTVISLYLAASGIHYFESEIQPDKFGSIFHGLWWAVVTLTTVGYGDVYPVTTGGRLFTFAILMIGMGIIAVPPGIISSALSKARQEQDRAAQTAASDQEAGGQREETEP